MMTAGKKSVQRTGKVLLVAGLVTVLAWGLGQFGGPRFEMKLGGEKYVLQKVPEVPGGGS